MGIRRFGVKICAYSILIQSGLSAKENVLVTDISFGALAYFSLIMCMYVK